MNQTLTDLQIIAMDDGSTDDSGNLLDRYAQGDHCIEVHHRPNCGLVPTLNAGIDLCRSEFIARMDADDIALPHRLELQLHHMLSHPNTLAMGSAIAYLGPAGLTGVRSHPPLSATAVANSLLKANCISHPTVMLRRSALMAVGGYRQAYTHAEDYDLWLRLRERGNLENVADVLLQYRIHDGQISARQLRTQAISVTAARLKIAPADVPTAAAEASILETAAGWAALLIKIRQLDAAAALIADDTFFNLASSPRRAAARRDWLNARLASAQGHYMTAFKALSRAGIRDPALLVETARKICTQFGR